MKRFNTPLVLFLFSSMLCSFLGAQDEVAEPLRYVLRHEGHDREYLVYLPSNYNSDNRYWPLVHARGARENALSISLRKAADEQGFNAILIGPILGSTGVIPAFPALGEGEFLKQVMIDARSKFRLHDKILLTGYSGRGQFTHRFTLQNPECVKAAAPMAPRSWTTPDGRYIEFGDNGAEDLELAHKEVEPFLSSEGGEIGKQAAKVAGLKAKPGADAVPFLVMCGSEDPRLESCRKFVQSLKDHGFKVETHWPVTGHAAARAPEAERLKYSSYPVEFFQRMTTDD